MLVGTDLWRGLELLVSSDHRLQPHRSVFRPSMWIGLNILDTGIDLFSMKVIVL